MTRAMGVVGPVVALRGPTRANQVVRTPQWAAVRTQRADRREPEHAKRLEVSANETIYERVYGVAVRPPIIRGVGMRTEGREGRDGV